MIAWKWNFPCFPLPIPQKLINISSEVMNIHIIPTQTRHFQTSYTKKVSHFHPNLLTWKECCCSASLLRQSVWPLTDFFFFFPLTSIDLSRVSLMHWRSDSVLTSGVTSTTAFGFTARLEWNWNGHPDAVPLCCWNWNAIQIQIYTEHNCQLGNELKYQQSNKVHLKFRI